MIPNPSMMTSLDLPNHGASFCFYTLLHRSPYPPSQGGGACMGRCSASSDDTADERRQTQLRPREHTRNECSISPEDVLKCRHSISERE